MSKCTNSVLSVGRGFSRLETRTVAGIGDYIMGSVITHHGIVDVYSQGDDRHADHTVLDFAHKGTLHTRTYKSRYSKRTIVTLAKAFAEEISKL